MLIASVFLFLAGVAQAANVCTYEGGWSLRVNANTCPINAPVNCGPGIQLRCCTNGLTCAGEGDYGGSWCCKEGEDCRSQASENPKCPDQTWTLWGGNGTLKDGGWCCQPGDNGFYRGNMDAVGCTAAGVRSLPTGYHFASTVSTVACVSPTSSATSTPTGASPTPTSLDDTKSDNASTPLSGGAIAGIVVGAVCGVALIAGIFTLVWYRKRKQHNNAAAYSPAGQGAPEMAAQNGDSAYYGGAGIYGDAASKHQQPSSPGQGAAQDNVSELGGVQRPSELPNDRVPHQTGHGRGPGPHYEME